MPHARILRAASKRPSSASGHDCRSEQFLRPAQDRTASRLSLRGQPRAHALLVFPHIGDESFGKVRCFVHLDVASIIAKPAMTSFASEIGSSITVGLPAENLAREPFALSCGPSVASSSGVITRLSKKMCAKRRTAIGGQAMRGSLGEKIGEGAWSDVHAWAPGQVVKLFKVGFTRRHSWWEARMTRAAPAPEVFDEVAMDGRFGVVLERLDGPTLAQLSRR